MSKTSLTSRLRDALRRRRRRPRRKGNCPSHLPTVVKVTDQTGLA